MEQNTILDLWDRSQILYEHGRDNAKAMGFKFTTRQAHFDRLMECEGFSSKGKGLYSSVWQKGGRYYKINSNISGPYDGFYAWIGVCINNPGNQALPKFGDMMQRGNRYCVEIERLDQQQLVDGPRMLYMTARTNLQLRDAIQLAVKTTIDLEGSGVHPERYVTNIDDNIIEMFLDVHAQNLMKRGSQLILNDPISNLGHEIKQEVLQYA